MFACMFHLGTLPDLVSLENGLTTLFPEKQRRIQKHSIVYYDTFDWRLYNAGFRLMSKGKRMILHSLNLSYPKLSIPFAGTPRRVSQIHSERMREILHPIVEVRALLPLVKLHVEGIEIKGVDAEKKTIIRCMIEQPVVEDKDKNKSLQPSLYLTGIKGYEKVFVKTKNWCLKQGFNLISTDLLVRALHAKGKKPGEYSSRILLHLDPALTAAQATQKILANLLYTMQQNESGLKDDIDVEFLHDFRVAVRRIRSLFGLLKNVFNPAVSKKAAAEFSEIGRLTNKMRDIDVYLLREERYKSMLPPSMEENIDPFFGQLKSDRKKELDKIKKYLSGDVYRRVMADWMKFSAESFQKVTSAQGKEPVHRFAQRIILKRYRKIIALGNKIGPQSADEALHRLRIECKKLRYLLEFFISLFPKRKMNQLIRHLKKLQDNLGLFNDLSIQQKKLRDYVSGVDPEQLRQTSLAIGVLIGRLYEEYQNVRLEFSDCFAQFSSPEIMTIFSELFEVKSVSQA